MTQLQQWQHFSTGNSRTDLHHDWQERRKGWLNFLDSLWGKRNLKFVYMSLLLRACTQSLVMLVQERIFPLGIRRRGCDSFLLFGLNHTVHKVCSLCPRLKTMLQEGKIVKLLLLCFKKKKITKRTDGKIFNSIPPQKPVPDLSQIKSTPPPKKATTYIWKPSLFWSDLLVLGEMEAVKLGVLSYEQTAKVLLFLQAVCFSSTLSIVPILLRIKVNTGVLK